MWIDVGNKTNILVCGGCTKCGGDVLMKKIDYYGTFVGFDTPKRLSFNGMTFILISLLSEDSVQFERDLSNCIDVNNEELYFCLEYCGIQQWNEGVLICEREIAKRGLNKVEVKERFEL